MKLCISFDIINIQICRGHNWNTNAKISPIYFCISSLGCMTNKSLYHLYPRNHRPKKKTKDQNCRHSRGGRYRPSHEKREKRESRVLSKTKKEIWPFVLEHAIWPRHANNDFPQISTFTDFLPRKGRPSSRQVHYALTTKQRVGTDCRRKGNLFTFFDHTVEDCNLQRSLLFHSYAQFLLHAALPALQLLLLR